MGVVTLHDPPPPLNADVCDIYVSILLHFETVTFGNCYILWHITLCDVHLLKLLHETLTLNKSIGMWCYVSTKVRCFAKKIIFEKTLPHGSKCTVEWRIKKIQFTGWKGQWLAFYMYCICSFYKKEKDKLEPIIRRFY